MPVWIFICDECHVQYELTGARQTTLYEWLHGLDPVEECPNCGHQNEARFDLYEPKPQPRWEHGC
jgi:hypothetical protein